MRRRPINAGRLRWATASLVVSCAAALSVLTSGAKAVVVDDQGTYAGVAMMPTSSLPGAVTPVTSSGTCTDPAMALTSYLAYQPGTSPLCWNGGSVVPANETFALTWDPNRSYWAGTRGYVEQFLRNVADDSGTFTSPYALTSQYTDGSGTTHAANQSAYGGGCIDYGNPTNSANTNTTCLFGSTVQDGPGNNYPTAGNCTPSGSSYVGGGSGANTTCLTDAQLQQELQNVVPQTGMLTHLKSSPTRYTPLVVMLLPPQVEVCIDVAGTLCSANSAATGKFCSYHSQVQMPDGTKVAYVVQPWTAVTRCDEPDIPAIPANPPVDQLANDVGMRLVSPISQAQIAAIVNPGLNGWYAQSGAEINDNYGCTPLGNGLDSVTVAGTPYFLQREFNNASLIESDPATYFGCAPDVILSPAFVLPSAVNPGDTVVFDGSATLSTLIVPNANYAWNFGDGTSAIGPSVVHSFATAGNYTVKLTITDRGGNKTTLAQSMTVLGANGQPVSNPPVGSPSGGNPSGGNPPGLFQAHLQLLPQSLRGVLRGGIAVRVSANQAASGIARVLITRAIARRLHIKVGAGSAVVIGQGTIASIKNGTVTLHLKLSRSVARKLQHLRHAALTVKLSLVGSAGGETLDAAGSY